METFSFLGLTIEADVDFTGGIPEMIELHRTKMAPERLFMIMEKADRRGAFMGCALSVSHHDCYCYCIKNFFS